MTHAEVNEMFGHMDLTSSLDSDTSPGAVWLQQLHDAATEAWDEGRFADTIRSNDVIAELADASVTVYTHARWQVFVDVCAYSSEEAEEVMQESPGDDMTETAASILYRMAERALDNWLTEKRATEPEPEEREHVDYPHHWGQLPGCWCEDEEDPEA